MGWPLLMSMPHLSKKIINYAQRSKHALITLKKTHSANISSHHGIKGNKFK